MTEIAEGYCHCGCGLRTKVALKSLSRTGAIAGRPNRFVHGHQSRDPSPEYRVDAAGCWVWLMARDRDGYGRTTHNGRTMRAHRWYFEQVNGAIPDGYELHHRCGQTACVNPAHLEIIDDARHARIRPTTKLDEEKAREIRNRFAAGTSRRDLAEQYEVCRGTIERIVRGQTWR